MPATRAHLDRDVKRSEILDAAEALMLRDGYHATSVAGIARKTGVATNAVYWYFPSKDDLLAGILERRLERGRATITEVAMTANLDGRVLALLAELDKVTGLTAAVHERARQSQAVAEMHLAFHAYAGQLLSDGFLDAGLDQDDARSGSEALMALIDGIRLHDGDRDPVARDRLVLWTVHRLVLGASQRVPAPA